MELSQAIRLGVEATYPDYQEEVLRRICQDLKDVTCSLDQLTCEERATPEQYRALSVINALLTDLGDSDAVA